MTTIATDGKSMAADGRCVTGSETIVEDACRKIVRLKDGRILGLAGKRSDLFLLEAWFNDPASPKPKFEGDALLLAPDGVFFVDSALIPIASQTPIALGSGKDHALTAMDIGASPGVAVHLASLRDPFTGGTITVEHLA